MSNRDKPSRKYRSDFTELFHSSEDICTSWLHSDGDFRLTEVSENGAEITTSAVVGARGLTFHDLFHAFPDLMGQLESACIGPIVLDRAVDYGQSGAGSGHAQRSSLTFVPPGVLVFAGMNVSESRVGGIRDDLVDIQERERERIALDVHDHLGSRLVELKLLLEGQKERDGRAGRDDALRLVSRAFKDLSRVTRRLRPGVLKEAGLSAALQSLCDDMNAAGRANPAVVARLATVQVPDYATSLAAYRIVQEALTNAIRHAGASRILVEMEVRNSELILTVQDDGDGFEYPADSAPADSGEADSLGLQGMTHRAEHAGGRLHIRSSTNGTTVEARLPAGGSDRNVRKGSAPTGVRHE